MPDGVSGVADRSGRFPTSAAAFGKAGASAAAAILLSELELKVNIENALHRIEICICFCFIEENLLSRVLDLGGEHNRLLEVCRPSLKLPFSSKLLVKQFPNLSPNKIRAGPL